MASQYKASTTLLLLRLPISTDILVSGDLKNVDRDNYNLIAGMCEINASERKRNKNNFLSRLCKKNIIDPLSKCTKHPILTKAR